MPATIRHFGANGIRTRTAPRSGAFVFAAYLPCSISTGSGLARRQPGNPGAFSTLIRTECRQARAMKKGRGALKAIVGELARSSERSPLFWWMVEHHDTLVSAAGGRRIQWKPLCAKFAALGLTDGTRKPATEKTAGETWRRARAEVARHRKDQAKAEAALFPTLRRVPAMARPNPNNPPPIVTPHSRQPEATKDGGSLDALDRTLRRISGREP